MNKVTKFSVCMHTRKGLETAGNIKHNRKKRKKEDYLPLTVRLYVKQHKLLREHSSCLSLGKQTIKSKKHNQ